MIRDEFLLPDLPKASYKIWVRGYGLVDSDPITAAPGKTAYADRGFSCPTPQIAAKSSSERLVFPASDSREE